MTTTFKTQSLAARVRKAGLKVLGKHEFGTGVSIRNWMSGGTWDRGYATVSCNYGSSHWHDEKGDKAAAMFDKLWPVLEAFCAERGLVLTRGGEHWNFGKMTVYGERTHATIRPKKEG